MKTYLIIAERKIRHVAQVEAEDATAAAELYARGKFIWDEEHDQDDFDIRAVEEMKTDERT